MAALGLMWGALWRMVLWGLGLGATLGAAYGAVAAPLGAVASAIAHEATGRMEIEPWAVPVAMLAAIPFGAIVGAIVGAVAGPVLGVLCWPVLLVLVRSGVLRSGDVASGRKIVGLAFAAATVSAGFAAWAARGFDSDALLVPDGSVGLFDGGVADAVLLRVAPALLAGGAAWFAGEKVFDWWVGRARRERHGDDSPAADAGPTGG